MTQAYLSAVPLSQRTSPSDCAQIPGSAHSRAIHAPQTLGRLAVRHLRPRSHGLLGRRPDCGCVPLHAALHSTACRAWITTGMPAGCNLPGRNDLPVVTPVNQSRNRCRFSLVGPNSAFCSEASSQRLNQQGRSLLPGRGGQNAG